MAPEPPFFVFATCYCLYRLGYLKCFANTMACGLVALPPELRVDGNVIFSTFQQLAGAVGTTVMTVCLGNVTQAGMIQPEMHSFAVATQTGAHGDSYFLACVIACAILANLRAFTQNGNVSSPCSWTDLHRFCCATR